jgi:hypothetical protein
MISENPTEDEVKALLDDCTCTDLCLRVQMIQLLKFIRYVKEHWYDDSRRA